MSDLPQGWMEVALDDACQIVRGITFPTTEKRFESGTGLIACLRTANVQATVEWDNLWFVPRHYVKNDEQLVSLNDILISTANSYELVGKVSRVTHTKFSSTLGAFISLLRSYKGIDAGFLYYQMSSEGVQRSIRDMSSTTTNISNVSGAKLKALRLHLAPAAEQTRIVEKLEELLSDLDAGVAELKAAQKKLGQYRQSLLKAAVEGVLTADWRASRQTPSPQPLPRQGGGASSFVPLPPRGGGAGGEGANSLATEDEPWLQARARELRQQQTPDEQALWQQLRAKRFSGHKFRRQQVLGRFIVDFVCFAQRLIVELDGGQHAEAVDYDNHRDTWLEQQGFRVLRFWNNEWSKQPEAVLESIWQALQQEPPLPNRLRPPRYALPVRGEGLMAPLPPCGGGAGGEGESGAQLLARILTERRARWEAKQLAKFAEQGKIPPKDWQKKYPEPVPPDTRDLPELPEGWVWASVDQVAEVFLGKMLDKTKHTSGMKMPYLRNVNVRWGSIETHDVSEMFFDNNEFDRYGLVAGDVLVCEGGEPGRAAICRKEHESLKYQKALHRVRLFDLYEPELLVAFLEFVAKTGRLEKTFTGSTINHFTKESFLTLQIPLAPMCEQREIIESLLLATSNIDEQKAALEIALKQSAAQRKNILKAAFSGQLVPQDPNDEPAAVLLERIRAERAERDTVKKPRGRKSKETV